MLMQNIYWSLGGDQFSSYDEFVEEVRRYNQRVAPDSTTWNPDQIVCTGPVTIVYEALWKDEDNTLEVVVSTAKEPISMGQLLFTLHNESTEFFSGADHCFFEGLEEAKAEILWLRTGS